MIVSTPFPRASEDREALLLAAQLELLAGVVSGRTLPHALESLRRVVERV